jgi:ribosomal protein L32
MLDLLIWVLVVWLLVGAACAGYVYLDMRKAKEMKALWIIVAFLLAPVGLVLYVFLVKRKKAGYTYPPKPEYSDPQYKYEKSPSSAKEEKKAEKQVQQLEGIPRCQECGAAISAHDFSCPKCGKKLR